MLSLRKALYCDLGRQYELEGRTDVQLNFLHFLKRVLHPRFLPNVFCRTSRAAMLAGIPLLPNLLTYLNLVLFGIEITPRCEIGPGIFFAHTAGVVIGARRIGSNVTVFQGVNLGAKHLDMNFTPEMRPEIGDNVVLGTGCKVLGPIYVGNNAIVGANSVVLDGVDADTTVAGIPARKVAARQVTDAV